MTKLFELASAQLSKTDDQKQLDALTDAVEDNKMAFTNDLHMAKKTIKDMQKRVDDLNANPYASSSQLLSANRELRFAEKNLEEITEIFEARF